MTSPSAVVIRAEARTPSPQLGGPLSPNHPNISRTNPQTPRRRKPAASVRLQGIKTTMPNNLSIPSISRRLISTLKLQYTPDDWQVHLIHWIFQGFDSIFCAGTGYGKSLVFEGVRCFFVINIWIVIPVYCLTLPLPFPWLQLVLATYLAMRRIFLGLPTNARSPQVECERKKLRKANFEEDQEWKYKVQLVFEVILSFVCAQVFPPSSHYCRVINR